MRSLLFAVVIFGIMPLILPGIQAQEPEDTPLFLGSGVHVDDHPNELPEYEIYAPRTSEVCAPEDMGNSCGRVWWNSRQQPALGTRYVAQVPAMIRLRGPGRDAWWVPFVHCMVKDEDRKHQSTSPPGVQCVTVLKRPEERMEWAIGGVIEGTDLAVSGTYTGIIPLIVTGPGTRWELNIPVTYTIHKEHDDCAISYSLFDYDLIDLGEPRGRATEITKTQTLTICHISSGGHDLKWEIDDLGPTIPSPTFELEIIPDRGNRTHIAGICNLGAPTSKSQVSFRAFNFPTEPGTYERQLKLRMWCDEG